MGPTAIGSSTEGPRINTQQTDGCYAFRFAFDGVFVHFFKIAKNNCRMFIIWNCDQQGYHYFLDVIDASDTVEPLDHGFDLGLFVKHVSSAKDQKG